MTTGKPVAIDPSNASAYGGAGWSPRRSTHRDEIGTLWGRCGVSSEWGPLRQVLLHEPGEELAGIDDPDAAQMLAKIDLQRARQQHRALADAYRCRGVQVHMVDPDTLPPPNLMYVADLVFMTPEGAIVGRTASAVRAGEERFVARRLSQLGIPILATIGGSGLFEGADAAWINHKTVMVATGLRTNARGAEQVADVLKRMGIEVVPVGLACGTMHLMGVLRFAAEDLAVGWGTRVPWAAVEALQDRGTQVLVLPAEVAAGMALNFVTLEPRTILMAAGNPITQAYYEQAGIRCIAVAVDELTKGAGGIGCLTGVLERRD